MLPPTRPLNVVSAIALDVGRMVRELVEEGLSPLEMLERLTVSHPRMEFTLDSVERLARQVADRRPQAKRYLQSKSLQMAMDVVTDGKPSDKVRVLEGLGEVLEGADKAAGGVTIIVGGDAHIALLHGPRE